MIEMNFKNWIVEGKEEDIANLQPDTVISVFHGTDPKTAYNFCINGIDGQKHQSRNYPHMVNSKKLKFGLFVTNDFNVTRTFGSVTIKFKVLGKDLIYQFPMLMKREDEFFKDYYPNSFRPAVSYDMLRGSEPQALFIGFASPRSIERVYTTSDKTWDKQSMTREEYIELAKNKGNVGQVYASEFEPQERRMDLESFVSRLALANGKTQEEVLKILKDEYRRSGKLQGIGEIPPTLLKRIESQLRKIL